MSITRDNHYVPRWHQKRFFTPSKQTHWLLDLQPPTFSARNGTVSIGRPLSNSPASKAFVEQDLYSTLSGDDEINDEIESKLFGDIDRRGADAIRAFCSDDQRAWHANFENLFIYLDIQKLRTPKGLAWLSKQYPEIGRIRELLPGVAQNQLMLEMQSIRMLNISTWATGVREIVSAERANTKFILSDHPVTVYNRAFPPSHLRNQYPDDPSPVLKGSQTLFPLGPDHLLILTNLEYAKNPMVPPDSKRTFARNYQSAMVSAVDFIKMRYFTDNEVAEANFVFKARAKRFIAASQRQDLYPESIVSKSWPELGSTFLPPKDQLYRFGGEIYAKMKDGDVLYQDEFGRSEKPRHWLSKAEPKTQPQLRGYCPCGSGRSFRGCCENKPTHLRMSWTQKSIRERNMMFMNALIHVLDLPNSSWMAVRRNMTDDKIADIYSAHDALWPLETDLLSLLPKPDGKMRSVYAGSLHPKLITEFALAAPLYFGEIIVQNPFIISRTLKREKRPTEHPHHYRGEVLKSIMTFLQIMPLVEAGMVTLIPDPCDFDFHLRDQVSALAKARSENIKFGRSDDPRLEPVIQEDIRRATLSMPLEALADRILKEKRDDEPIEKSRLVQHLKWLKENDELAVLQEGSLERGRLEFIRLAPNFEIAMYLAQATGGQILTDSIFRWRELQASLARRPLGTTPVLTELQQEITSTPIDFPIGHEAIFRVLDDRINRETEALFGAAFTYTAARTANNLKPNYERQLAARFRRQRSAIRSSIARANVPVVAAHLTTAFRLGGFQDNTINRLLLMSGSEHHSHSVPMATFIQRWEVRT